MSFLPDLILVFLSTSQEIVAGKRVSDMTYVVWSVTLKLNSVSRSVSQSLEVGREMLMCGRWTVR